MNRQELHEYVKFLEHFRLLQSVFPIPGVDNRKLDEEILQLREHLGIVDDEEAEINSVIGYPGQEEEV